MAKRLTGKRRFPSPIARSGPSGHIQSVRQADEVKLGTVDEKPLLAEYAKTGRLPAPPAGWTWFPCIGCRFCSSGSETRCDHWQLYPTYALEPSQIEYAALLRQLDGQPAKPPLDVRQKLKAQAEAAAVTRRLEETRNAR